MAKVAERTVKIGADTRFAVAKLALAGQAAAKYAARYEAACQNVIVRFGLGEDDLARVAEMQARWSHMGRLEALWLAGYMKDATADGVPVDELYAAAPDDDALWHALLILETMTRAERIQHCLNILTNDTDIASMNVENLTDGPSD